MATTSTEPNYTKQIIVGTLASAGILSVLYFFTNFVVTIFIKKYLLK